MIYILKDRYIITDLGKQLHITDLLTGDSWKRIKTQSDHMLINQAKKII